jgi:hypothetical protein
MQGMKHFKRLARNRKVVIAAALGVVSAIGLGTIWYRSHQQKLNEPLPVRIIPVARAAEKREDLSTDDKQILNEI